jgi:hypothetical protein
MTNQKSLLSDRRDLYDADPVLKPLRPWSVSNFEDQGVFVSIIQ